jgi:hypothetical protein
MNPTTTTLPNFRTIADNVELAKVDDYAVGLQLENPATDQKESALMLNPRATPEMMLAYGVTRLRRLLNQLRSLSLSNDLVEYDMRGLALDLEAGAEESLMLCEAASRAFVLARATAPAVNMAGPSVHARRPAAPDFSGIADILTAATVDLNHLLAAAMIRGGAAESAEAKFMERVRHTAKSVEADLHGGLELLRSEVPDEAAIEGILTARAVDLESLAGLATSKTSSDGVDLAFAQTVARTARKVSTELGEANELLQAGALAS